MTNSIVILGQTDCPQVIAIANELNDPIIIDDEAIEHRITIRAGLYDIPALYLDNQLLKPKAVCWRDLDLYPFETEHFPNDVGHFKLFLEAFKNARMVNPLPAFVDHYTKIDQSRQVQALMPDSLITNRYQDAVEFASQFESVAVKPLTGGDYVCRFEDLNDLPREPMMLQEFIEGDNIRTFVFEDKVYSAIAVSDYDDFRLDDDMVYEPIELTDEQTKTSIKIANSLGYKYTAIDWIRRDGRLYFLEANFSPMFIYYEQCTGYPITKSIVNLLIK